MRDTTSASLRIIAAVLFFAVAATLSAHAQTDLAISGYGAFTGTTEGNGTIQSAPAHAGAMIEFRHIHNPLVGYDVNYSYNRANQSYNFNPVNANANEAGVSWVISVPLLNFRPFVLGGLGALYFHSDSGQSGTSSEVKLVYVYGAGLDWTVIPHFGVRFQYRGNLYHAPDLIAAFSSTDAFTHTAEPMFGAYVRF